MKQDKTVLSPREAEIQALRDKQLTPKQIAQQLGISHGTVGNYIRSINQRMTGHKIKGENK
jgi:DNA-binding CsgD family transcriptional regulator